MMYKYLFLISCYILSFFRYLYVYLNDHYTYFTVLYDLIVYDFADED